MNFKNSTVLKNYTSNICSFYLEIIKLSKNLLITNFNKTIFLNYQKIKIKI